MKIHIFDNKIKKETYCFESKCKEPIEFVFVKNRKTKERFLLERTKGQGPFANERFLHPCEYTQYDDIEIQLEN